MASVPNHRFRYRTRRHLMLWKTVIGLAIAGSGLLTHYGHDNPIAMTAAALFVAVAVAVFVVSRHGDALTIDDRGLRFGFTGARFVGWPDIETVQFRRIDDIGFLLINRTATARAAEPPGRWQRIQAQRCEATDLVVPLLQTVDDARQIYKVVSMALTIARRGTTTVKR